MATHKLIPYWIHLTKKYQPEERVQLNNLMGEGTDFSVNNIIDAFDNFCSDYNTGYEKLPKMEKTLSVKNTNSNDEIIEGVLRTGRYGTGADHRNVNDDSLKEEARGADDAVVLPYYFLIVLPSDNKKRALLILEKIGNLGTKMPFEEVVSDWMGKRGNCLVHYDPVVTEDLYEKVENADRLLSLELTKTRSAKALHDQLGSPFKSYGQANEKLIFDSSTAGGNIPVNVDELKDVFFNSERSAVTIRDQEFSDGKLRIEDDGSQRTLSLFQEEVNMNQVLDFEKDDIDLDNQGHPDCSDLSEVARDFANDILDDHNEDGIPGKPLL
ncbi:hypothetical protein HALLA_09705 [Halostagnicola larsenii XH-48]|uniref:Uncharacterized protein n=1 Tax=Halostagnicola larsenii XH-48 TaxID=797299 RepID=W0JUE7_9EURY|nr:hypothetical protein [Halostagnicola larsenii]AHG00841.1 hypothetical protein HALLA_09540 [Halostagnicola larsenii XH-48]AHG00860.1 hypothetical protein HALLA_09705 [Halostagnicola larsenii XH-48]